MVNVLQRRRPTTRRSGSSTGCPSNHRREDDYPEYLSTPEGLPPFGEEFATLLTQFSDETETVEWVFPTPRAVLTASALDPVRIQDEGSVPYGAVSEELADAGAEATTTE